MRLTWQVADRLPEAAARPPDPRVVAAVTAAGIGGPRAAEAAVLVACRTETAARDRLLHRLTAQTGWDMSVPALAWLAASPADDGQLRERQLISALNAGWEDIARHYRMWYDTARAAVVGWVRTSGCTAFGLSPGQVARCADELEPSVSGHARGLSVVAGDLTCPIRLPDPVPFLVRARGVVIGLGLDRRCRQDIRFVLAPGRGGGWCRTGPTAVTAAVRLTGTYRDGITILHELGHAVSYAVGARTPTSLATLAVSEAFAHLFAQLARDPRWAGSWIDRHQRWAVSSRRVVRRVAAARWRFITAAVSDPQTAMQSWAHEMGQALAAPVVPAWWLTERDSPRDTLVYVLAAALAGAMTGRLRAEAGPDWHASPHAGQLLFRWMTEADHPGLIAGLLGREEESIDG